MARKPRIADLQKALGDAAITLSVAAVSMLSHGALFWTEIALQGRVAQEAADRRFDPMGDLSPHQCVPYDGGGNLAHYCRICSRDLRGLNPTEVANG